ncbi:MAG: hypothetical protein PWP04_1426 [Candidatus Atribacteria bacterium]|nr:hypothetical protein [Candidatus Atribacteria bacterium]
MSIKEEKLTFMVVKFNVKKNLLLGGRGKEILAVCQSKKDPKWNG